MQGLFFGKIDGGRVMLYNNDLYKERVANLEGQEIAISIGKRKKTRSIKENSYYWAVIISILSQEMGLTADETHDLLKSMFLKHGVEIKGKRYELIRSTASLSTEEFEKYAEDCRRFGAMELNCSIPLPNEVNY